MGFWRRLREDFPTAQYLAYQRVMAGRTIFFDPKSHKLLRGFTKSLVLAALIRAQKVASRCRVRVHLSIDERKLWNRHFEKLLGWLIPGSLLLFDLFDYWQ